MEKIKFEVGKEYHTDWGIVRIVDVTNDTVSFKLNDYPNIRYAKKISDGEYERARTWAGGEFSAKNVYVSKNDDKSNVNVEKEIWKILALCLQAAEIQYGLESPIR